MAAEPFGRRGLLRREGVVVAVVHAEHVVRRADHVEVQVERDVLELPAGSRPGRRRSARSRAGRSPRRPTRRSAPCCRGAPPPAIASAVSSSAALPEPLSLMPLPPTTLSRWAPAMTTFWRVAPGLGGDVPRGGVLGHGVGDDVGLGAIGHQRVTRWRWRRPRRERRRGRQRHPGEGAAALGGVALVEDDDPDGAGGGGVVHLVGEVTGAAPYECDVAGGEAREVAGLAAAGRRIDGRGVDRLHRGGDVAGAGVLEGDEAVVGLVLHEAPLDGLGRSKVDGPVCSKNGNVKAWTFGV